MGDLHRNQLTALPESIGQLTALGVLKLYQNPLTGLPESMVQLTGLFMLSLDENQLAAMPASLIKLKALAEMPHNHSAFGAIDIQDPREVDESAYRLCACCSLLSPWRLCG